MTTTLPAYKITYNDGSSYVTSMAKDVTLETARSYFIGSWHVQNDETTMLKVVDVQSV